ncbi:BREX system P-loop protein BrxC [Desulfosediminicola sp.]|uniref:BREX system P-loop protein BrxC n=1 Tax=Desulfosediminicola sp. TaxID=2886825 RepID=UPI003AF2799D
MSRIKDVFFRNIDENIAPVIYFHQLEPSVAAQEVGEYIFTTRPTSQGNQLGGIHEQMVSLLNQISIAIDEGHKLPASWISGFFGSGKSSFAKLLGLALDRMELPNGTTMDKALLERDDTPNFKELHDVFEKLSGQIDSMAVIFDIGTAAKNNESTPHTIYRHILQKLGYSRHDGVAYYEVALEDEGHYDEFLTLYQEQYSKTWAEKCSSALAPQQFRAIYKKIFPEQDDLLETSTFSLNSLSIQNMVSNLYRVIERRVPGKTIFIVVDEVSQYIDKDQNKMLDLQSFVSEIGGRVRNGKSPLWLLVTGQEKLEEESKESVLFKLQDRFPPALRVHLDRANVKEVVSRRLLKKKSGSELETIVSASNLDTLKLHAYECEGVTREQIIEHYPLLPGHIPLFMDITQCIRSRSARTQSDAGGVRSVLNNIWDLFNREPVALKNRAIGTLMTLDMLYDIIGSSIDSDVQLTLHKAFEKKGTDTWETKVIKAISLLEMNAEQLPVQLPLLSSLLYPELGASSVENEVKAALENLKKDNWIHYHEKYGWRVQNNAAQDWNRQKSEISVPSSRIIDLLIDLQKEIVSTINQPILDGARFPLESYWGLEQKITGKNDPTKVTLCFHWIENASKRKDLDTWINLSRQHKSMFHWVSGNPSSLESKVREFERSQRMIARYKGQGELQPLKQQLMYQEQAESERLWEEIKKELRQVWIQGVFFFDGHSFEMSQAGASFENALKAEIEKNIGQLFHKFSQGHISITESDYRQLLEKDTSGLGLVFFDGDGGLGIAQNDAGRIIFKCGGQVPRSLFQYLEERTYLTGEQLIKYFGADPFGYSTSVIKASVIGLLREERLRVIDNKKNEITSIQDPGAKSLFEQHREFLRAEIEINKEITLTGRDRTTLRKFFENSLGLSHVESESDKLADLVFKHFPEWKDKVSELTNKLGSLNITVPEEMKDFNKALTACLENRQVQKTLERVKGNLKIIEKGVARVKEIEESFNEDTEKELRQLKNILEVQVKQLEQVEEESTIQDSISSLTSHMQSSTPWRGYADVKPMAVAVVVHYKQIRKGYKIQQQDELDTQLSQIKLRPDFGELELDKQQEVLHRISKVFIDVDEEAVQPQLLLIKQTPDRIREATSEAHRFMDQLVNESGANGDGPEPDNPKPRVHTIRLGLRNKIISDENELERVFASLKEQCLKELNAGIKVRFEE